MNPLAVESALKSALLPFFSSGVTIYTGTSYAVTQPESLNIVASVDDLQHQAGGLYLAEATIRLIGPALYGAQVFGDLQTAIASVQSALGSPDFAAGWPAGSPSFGGLFVRTATSKQQGEQWDVEVSVRLGVQFS